MQVFTLNGLNDVIITATNTMATNIEIRCGPVYALYLHSCVLEQASPWNSCTDVDSSCNYVSYSPTSNPTTTNPTIDPTTSPTIYPSLPSSNPTISPSISPSVPSSAPTRAPSPLCAYLRVDIIGATPFDQLAFEGLFAYQPYDSMNGNPIYRSEHIDKTIYFEHSSWIIKAKGINHTLSLSMDSQHPPLDQQSHGWIHSLQSGVYNVSIDCVETTAPIAEPTTSPTTSPSFSPSSAPTSYPTMATSNPTMQPTYPLYSPWVEDPSMWGTPIRQSPLAYYAKNNSILIIGSDTANQFVEINLNASSTNGLGMTINYGREFFSKLLYCEVDCYVQHNNIFYIWSHRQHTFADVFDMDTLEMRYNVYSMQSRPKCCAQRTSATSLSLEHDYLINIFAEDDVNYITVFNLSSDSWLDNDGLPITNYYRSNYYNSEAVDQKIYIMGGSSIEPGIVEILDLSGGMENIAAYSWRNMSVILPTMGLSHFRHVVIGSDIIIVRGVGYIDILNTITESTWSITAEGYRPGAWPFTSASWPRDIIYIHPFIYMFASTQYHRLEFSFIPLIISYSIQYQTQHNYTAQLNLSSPGIPMRDLW